MTPEQDTHFDTLIKHYENAAGAFRLANYNNRKKIINPLAESLLQIRRYALRQNTPEFNAWLNNNEIWLAERYQFVRNARVELNERPEEEINEFLNTQRTQPAEENLVLREIISSLSRNTNDINALTRLGDLIYEQGFGVAILSYLEALRLAPNDFRIDLKLADAYYKAGVYTEAWCSYNNANQKNPPAEKAAEISAKIQNTRTKCEGILLSACRSCNIDKVRAILDFNIKPPLALIEAVKGRGRIGIIDLIDLLIDNGYNGEEAGGDGWNAVHWAAKENNTDDILRRLHDKCRSAFDNKTGKGFLNGSETPLIAAARYNNSVTAKFLIDNRLGIDSQDKSYWTPLHWACKNEQLDIVNLLINAHANLDSQDSSGDTPLHITIPQAKDGRFQRGSARAQEIVRLLVSHGASTTIMNSAGKAPQDIARGSNVEAIINNASQVRTNRNQP